MIFKISVKLFILVVSKKTEIFIEKSVFYLNPKKCPFLLNLHTMQGNIDILKTVKETFAKIPLTNVFTKLNSLTAYIMLINPVPLLST